MKAIILLNHSENTRQVEEEEKTRFLKSVLEQMGVPIDEFWMIDHLLLPHQKIKLRSLLTSYNIQVIDDHDGKLEVYVEKELVGVWNKCTYKLKKNLQEIDPRKKLFIEMYISCWSMFEESEEESIL